MGKARVPKGTHKQRTRTEYRSSDSHGVANTMTVTCSHCGKKGFPSRKAAKSLSKFLRAGDDREGLREYECETGLWHVGHMHRSIRQGQLSRADRYDQ